MADLLHELENNESVLLMYLAGELPDSDVREVEQMLATDATLRRQLEEMRGELAACDAALATVDAASGPLAEGAAVEASVRRVGRAMRQWQARRLTAPAAVVGPVVRGGMPWWAAPSAVAAGLIGFLVWWGNAPAGDSRPVEVARGNTQFVDPVSANPVEGEVVALDLLGLSGGLQQLEDQASHLAELQSSPQ